MATHFTDGTQSEVEDAIGDANAGDVIELPEGEFEYGAGTTSVSVNKRVKIRGQGVGTEITLADDGPQAVGVFALSKAYASVENLKVIGSGVNRVLPFSVGTEHNTRISRVTFEAGDVDDAKFAIINNVYGLCDLCDLTGARGNQELIFMRGPTDSWTTDPSMGTINAYFIERNIFRGPGYVCDANSYARLVTRFNVIHDQMKIDGHGYASNTPAAGVRQMETYHNTWLFDDNTFWTAIELRGGTGMCFNNTAAVAARFQFNEYGCLAQWPNFGNTFQTPANYPITHQIGRGKNDGSEPYYIWNNVANGSPWALTWEAVAAGAITLYGAPFTQEDDIIVADRDYFSVSTGTHAQMLAVSSPATGQRFWVTDEGTWNLLTGTNAGRLYKYNGAAWVLDYTPYRYPHDLATMADNLVLRKTTNGSSITVTDFMRRAPRAGGAFADYAYTHNGDFPADLDLDYDYDLATGVRTYRGTLTAAQIRSRI